MEFIENVKKCSQPLERESHPLQIKLLQMEEDDLHILHYILNLTGLQKRVRSNYPVVSWILLGPTGLTAYWWWGRTYFIFTCCWITRLVDGYKHYDILTQFNLGYSNIYLVFKVILNMKRRISSKWLSSFSDIHYFQSINFYLLLLQIHDLEIW